MTWLQCWGIPLVAWDRHHIQQIVLGIGDVVDVEDCVEERRSLEVARILVKTPWKPLIQHTVTVNIQGEKFQVHVAEECGHSGDRWQQRRGSDFSSSEEINSEEGDDEVSNGGAFPSRWHKFQVLDSTAGRKTADEDVGVEVIGMEEDPTTGVKEQEDDARRGRDSDDPAKSETRARSARDMTGGTAADSDR